MKSQFAGIVLFSLILVFVISFGHIGTSIGSGTPIGPENLMLTTPTYYVGGEDAQEGNEGTSPEDAWVNISTAMLGLSEVNGYILYVAAGSYDDSFSVSSSGTSLISNQIIANGDVTLAPESSDYVIDVNGKSNISITGFEISSSNYDGIYIHGDSDNIILNDISISSIGSGTSAGICIVGDGTYNPDSIDIIGCDIEGDAFGVNICNSSTDVDIISNTISDCSLSGINISSNCDTITIENNTIESCSTSGINVTNNCDNGSINDNTITLGTCTNGVKIYTSCEDWYITSNDIDVNSGSYGIYLDGVTNPILVNNMVDGSYSNAIVYDKDSENFSMNYNTLRNKTEYGSMKGYHGYRSSLTAGCYVESFHNNIISLPTTNYGHVMYIDSTSSYWLPQVSDDISNNIYYRGQYCGFYNGSPTSTLGNWQSALGASYDANSYREDPKFISSTDLHLMVTSPGFGAGVPIDSVTTDIDDHTRNTTNPNIGADELVALSIASGETLQITWEINMTTVTIGTSGVLDIVGPVTGIDVNFATLTVNGVMSVSGNVIVKSDTMTVSSTGAVQVGDVGTELRAINMTIESGGVITADEQGFAACEGYGCGITSTYGGGGGAYRGDGAKGGASGNGGDGGLASNITSHDEYQYVFYYADKYPGSGGGNGSGTTGGTGGGVIHIEVFETLLLSGDITANGGDGDDASASGESGAGGGSGGGVFVLTEVLSGSGTISAKGGAGGDGYGAVSNGGGGASGGGVDVYIKTEDTSAITILVTQGPGGDDTIYTADPGTIEVKDNLCYCHKGTCCDSNAAIEGGIFGNESISMNDLCVVTEYEVTNLDFNDGVSRNLELYYGSKNGLTDSTSPIGSEGWTHSLNENLDVSNAQSDHEIIYTKLCGATVPYQDPENDGTFVPPPFFGDMPPIEFDANSNTYSMTSKDGTSKVFNGDGLWTSMTDTSGSEMTMSYDGSDRLDYVEMADGRAVDISYDGSTNRVTSVSCYEKVIGTTPTNLISDSTVSFTYAEDSGDFELSDVVYDDGEWEFTYDVNGHLDQQKLEYKSGQYRITDFNINSDGRCTEIKDESNNTKTFSKPSPNNHETIIKDRNDKYWTYECDPLMNVVTKSTDPQGNVWEKGYDDKRRMIRLDPPDNGSGDESNSYTEYTYDSKGNTLSVKIVKDNNHSLFTYSSYTYDSYSNMTASYGPYANVTSGTEYEKTKVEYKYPDQINGSGMIECTGGTTITGYSTLFTDEIEVGDTITANSQTKTVTAITSDTQLSIDSTIGTYTGSYTINSDYDSSRLVKEIVRKIDYDATLGEITFTTHYNYDADGRVIEVIYNYGDSAGKTRTTQYEYYNTTNTTTGALTGFLYKSTVVNPYGTDFETTYTYYVTGNVKEVTGPTGIVTQYVYNPKGQVLYTCVNPTGEKLGSEYTYNLAGDITTVKTGHWNDWSTFDLDDDTTDTFSQIDYAYDILGRLKAVKNRESLGSVYTYDNVGNTLSVMSGEVTAFLSYPTIIYTGQAYSQIQYEYNENGSLKETTSKLDATHDAVVTYTYLPNGSIATITGPEYNLSNNMASKYEYDYVGRVTKSYVKIAEPTTYVYNETAYDNFGRVSFVTDAESKQISYSYNDYSGSLTKVSNIISGEDNLETDYKYNDFGQITRVTYAAQGTNSQEIYKFNVYDNLGRVIQSYTGDSINEAWADGVNRVEYNYDTVTGRMFKKTIKDIDSTDLDIEYNFDNLNRIEYVCSDTTTLLEGSKYTYDVLGRVTRVDQVKYSAFSGLNNTNTVYGNPLLSSKTVYDKIGRVEKSILNPVASSPTRLEDITTYYEYDELSRVVKVMDPQQWYTYNNSTPQVEEYTAYSYDIGSRLTDVIAHVDLDGTGASDQTLAEYSYFNNGARASMSYYQASTPVSVNYLYYPTGWLQSVEYPGYDGDSDLYGYEYYDTGVLNKVTHGDYVNDLFEYSYDDAWRLTEIKTGGATDKKFSYNDRSQIHYIMDASETPRYEYIYDTFGRVSSTKDSTQGVFTDKQISYSYTDAGLRKTMTTPDYELQYSYDSSGKYTLIDRKVSGVWKKLADYDYNELGQRIGFTRWDDTGSNVVVHTQYDYLDNVGWLQYVENRKQVANPGTYVISAYKYYDSTEGDSNDLVGNREYMEYLDGSYVEYDYDPLYRLTTETRKNSGGVQQAKYEFDYDLAGNRVEQRRYSTTANWTNRIVSTFNSANQLVTTEEFENQASPNQIEETQYVYNDLGSLIEKNIENTDFNDPEYNDEQWDYAYDAYSRLIDVDKDSNNVGDYTFNMLGNRVKKVTNSDTIKMLYNGYDCVADYNDADNLLRHYITPGLDENVLVYDVDNTEEYFYLHDGLGTVRQIINDTQTIENNYDYEGFGTSISHSENIYNRYRYTGREYDKETESDPDYNGGVGTKDGLYYYRARTYDSTIGSFTSRDPIPYANLYPYCTANPVKHRDSFGKHVNDWEEPRSDDSDTCLGGVHNGVRNLFRMEIDLGVDGQISINWDPESVIENKNPTIWFEWNLDKYNGFRNCSSSCCKFGWVQHLWHGNRWLYDNGAFKGEPHDRPTYPQGAPSNPYTDKIDINRNGEGTDVETRWKNNPWYGGLLSYELTYIEEQLHKLLEQRKSQPYLIDPILDSKIKELEEWKSEVENAAVSWGRNPQPQIKIRDTTKGHFITQLVCLEGDNKGKVYFSVEWKSEGGRIEIVKSEVKIQVRH